MCLHASLVAPSQTYLTVGMTSHTLKTSSHLSSRIISTHKHQHVYP